LPGFRHRGRGHSAADEFGCAGSAFEFLAVWFCRFGISWHSAAMRLPDTVIN
jgi:hypothetical protein